MYEIERGVFLELISVIVPIYKVEEYLDQCIKSIVEQTYRNLEIILVDDGSPDSCPLICDEWAKYDHRIIIIHKENGGLSDARNTGLHKSSGKYISFVDSDDWLAPDFFEILYYSITKNNAQIAAGGIVKVYENYQEQDQFIYDQQIFTSEEALETLMQGRGFYAVAWNKLYKKSLFDGIEFPLGKLHEDEFVTYKLIGKSTKLTLCQEAIYFYRQRKCSIMQEWSIRHLDALEAFVQRNSYLKQHFPNLYLRDKVILLMACVAFFRKCADLPNSDMYKDKILKYNKDIKFTFGELIMLDKRSLIQLIKGKVFLIYASKLH